MTETRARAKKSPKKQAAVLKGALAALKRSERPIEAMRVVVLEAGTPLPRKRAAGLLQNLAKHSKIPLLERVANANVIERVALEETGVPAPMAKTLFKHMHFSDPDLYEYLGVTKSTYHRRMTGKYGVIDGTPGQTVVGYADLLIFLQTQLAEYGNPEEAATFDAAKWLGEWLREPNPALGGAQPAALMRAPTGRDAVTRVLGANFSGSFQ